MSLEDLKDKNGFDFGVLKVWFIQTDEKVETLDYILNNAFNRVLPEELYFTTMLIYIQESSSE